MWPCKLWFHDWSRWGDPFKSVGYATVEVLQQRACRRCGQIEVRVIVANERAAEKGE